MSATGDGRGSVGGDCPYDARLYCVIVTYKRHAMFASALNFAASQRLKPELIVVVDNEGSAAVAQTVGELEEVSGIPIALLRPGDNLGPAGGTALAMEHILTVASDADWITRLDDDVDEAFDVFEELLRFAVEQKAADSSVGAVGGMGARYDWTRGQLIRVSDDEISAGPVLVDYVPTNVFPAFNVEAVRAVGVFDAQLFYGSSEVEYGLRLRQAGYRIVADPVIWQLVGRRSADTSGPGFRLRPFGWRRYYSLRNQIHLLRQSGHGRTALRVAAVRAFGKPLLNLPVQPKEAWRHLRWNARAVWDGWRGRLGRTYDPESFT